MDRGSGSFPPVYPENAVALLFGASPIMHVSSWVKTGLKNCVVFLQTCAGLFPVTLHPFVSTVFERGARQRPPPLFVSPSLWRMIVLFITRMSSL